MKALINLKAFHLLMASLLALSCIQAQTVTYLWSNGATTPGIDVNPSQTTTYYVTMTQSGIQYFDSVVVVVNPLPAAPQISSNSPVNPGATIQLSASSVAGASYSWTGPNGFTSNLQNPVINNATVANSGTYSVTVTVNGCTSTLTATQIIVGGNPNIFTLYMDTIPGINGQEVLMPIRVKNFNNMLSAQFTLQFDPSVISYAGFLNPGIPSITGGSFGQAQINNGVLTFAWSQPNVTPVSLADDELLVNLRFNVIGAGGSFSPITFINSPTPIEFVDQSFVPLNAYQTLPGRVDVLNIASLSGNLKTETGQPVRSATVASTGFATESTQSNLAGQYSLLLPQGQSYSISPSKGNDTLVTNGITTLDVLLIQRHILNILPLNTPYKIIAADVNQSGTVTSADLNLINALILANISAYPSGQFWAFVPDNHVFSNPQNPFPFPAARTYNNLNTAVNQDFFGMKLGDVNNSYNPALARLSRSENAVELYVENQDVTEEATIQVPVKVKNFSDIAGFQFAVQWDAQVLRYIEINPANGGLDVNKGETMTEDGKLNINWIEPNASAISLNDESILFNITFEVVGALGSNTDVEIYSSLTTPVEIITAELEVAEHSLQEGIVAVTTPSSIAEVFVEGLSLNVYPNPYMYTATIQIESHIQRNVSIEIFDASGRRVSKEDFQVQQGNTNRLLNVNNAAGNYLLVLSDSRSGKRLANLNLIQQ